MNPDFMFSANLNGTTYYFYGDPFDQYQPPYQEILQPPPNLHCLAVLGLKPGVSKDEIKQAYRRLVKIHHPDHGGDPAKFQEIHQAYEEASA